MRPIYKINYNRMVVLLLPILLRKSLLVAWLQAVVAPIALLQGIFNAFRMQIAYELGINGQVCFLKKMLNDQFDSSQRRIYIDDVNDFQRFYIYKTEETNPTYLYTPKETNPIYLFAKDDFIDTGFDFYVILNGVTLTMQQRVAMRILIDKYKLVTKKYEIR